MEQTFERIQRASIPEADAILGKPFPVLNDGFIRLIDYMGSDEAIVQAARVSYGKGTKKKNEDEGLIRHLLRNWHTSPFEMCEVKFHVRTPMDVWRQWIRHRTASVNEYSTRYSLAIDERHATNSGEWRFQSSKDKQGSGEFMDIIVGERLSSVEAEFHATAQRVYQERIDAGVAREQARKDLPLSTYTEAYWKIDLHNLLHFLRLRMDPHAQLEIRKYARIIGEEIVAKIFPMVWKAFKDFELDSMRLSGPEIAFMRDAKIGANIEETTLRNLAEKSEMFGKTELNEFVAKLVHLGFIVVHPKE